MHVAVIGAGWFSPNHLLGWQLLTPAVRVTAVCDADLARATSRARQFGDDQTAACNSPDEVIKSRPGWLDLVLPPAAQAEWLALALDCGLPVICQKPFGRSFSEAQRWTERFEAAGMPLVIHENFRFAPWFRAMRQAIDEGLLGSLHGLQLRLRPGDGHGEHAYLDRQPYFRSMPRLLVAETAVHGIDLVCRLLGPVQAVTARLRRLNPGIAGEDAALLIMECLESRLGTFDGNRLNDHDAANSRHTLCEAWLEGSAGVLRLDGDGALHWQRQGERRETQWTHPQAELPGAFGGASAALCAHVLGHVRDGTPLQNQARSYLEVMRVQEAAYASHNRGQRIELAGFDPPAQPELPHL